MRILVTTFVCDNQPVTVCFGGKSAEASLGRCTDRCAPSSYRDAAEVQAVRKERDPINLLTAYALDGNLVTEDELKVRGCDTVWPSLLLCGREHAMNSPSKSIWCGEMVPVLYQNSTAVNMLDKCPLSSLLFSFQGVRKEVIGHIEEAVEFSLAGSELPTPELYTHVYANQGDLAVRGCDPFTWSTTA